MAIIDGNYFDRYESYQDALMTAIRMSAYEIKEVATKLWPSLPVQTAYQRLLIEILCYFLKNKKRLKSTKRKKKWFL